MYTLANTHSQTATSIHVLTSMWLNNSQRSQNGLNVICRGKKYKIIYALLSQIKIPLFSLMGKFSFGVGEIKLLINEVYCTKIIRTFMYD